MIHSSFQVNSHSMGREEQCGSNDDTRLAAIHARVPSALPGQATLIDTSLANV
jgi:hypothetical protein